jgi:phosphoglycolate phosphatase-like HAD superfamily hydrolase
MTARPHVLDAAAIIFDIDGTLVDSVDFHAAAWQRAFAAFGHNFEYSRIRSQIGKGGDQLLPVFLSEAEQSSEGPSIEQYRGRLFEKEYMPQVRGFPKVPELFRLLVGRGRRIALGSSAKAKDLPAYKRVAGIEGIPLVEASSDDAERSKPHPDIFNAALSRLGLRADQVVVVGDTPYDIEAARKAGMTAIAVLCGGFSESLLRRSGASQIYRDPAHLLDASTQAVEFRFGLTRFSISR